VEQHTEVFVGLDVVKAGLRPMLANHRQLRSGVRSVERIGSVPKGEPFLTPGNAVGPC